MKAQKKSRQKEKAIKNLLETITRENNGEGSDDEAVQGTADCAHHKGRGAAQHDGGIGAAHVGDDEGCRHAGQVHDAHQGQVNAAGDHADHHAEGEHPVLGELEDHGAQVRNGEVGTRLEYRHHQQHKGHHAQQYRDMGIRFEALLFQGRHRRRRFGRFHISLASLRFSVAGTFGLPGGDDGSQQDDKAHHEGLPLLLCAVKKRLINSDGA